MNNKNKIIIAIIIVLVISVLGVGIWMLTSNNKETDVKVSQSTGNGIEHKDSLTAESIENVEKNEPNVSSTPISIVGTYSNKSETSNYIHDANLVITNQTNSSIDFKLSAVHGSDVDHVNTGEVSGKATKIDIPQDSVIPESTQYAYQFIDNMDGKTSRITFVYTAHRMFEYVTVIEDYSDGINPYAGNRVYFEGEYEKISTTTSSTESTNSQTTTTNENTSNEAESQTQLKINGTYSNKSETSNYVHDASLVITNQTNSSIDFKLSAVHGSDVDHVNTGEVSGKATKIDIPQDSVIPESTQYAYQFVDNVDGRTCKITFVYTAHRMFEYVTVIEDYSDGINPYAGNRVYFEGEYEKIS